jgi:peptidoglycan-N-acetylglucosamine deacetylase
MKKLYWAAAGAAAVYYAGFSPTSQLLGAFPYRVDTDEKVIALTFDDGPNEPYTSDLLDLLADRAVPATFFQVGKCVERHPDTSRRMVEAGHVIGNHTYSHRFSAYLTQPRMRTEIGRTQGILRDTIGRTPALFRPPWLGRQPLSLATVRAYGMQVVSGQFAHPLEVVQPAAERMARHAVSITRPGSILIFHDGFDARGGARGQTVAAVGLVIDALRQRGFRFDTVDRLLGVPAYQGVSGPGS